MRILIRALCVGMVGLLMAPQVGEGRGRGWMYEVKITNITKGTDTAQGMTFTPILVVAHRPSISLFELGEPASEGVAVLAESGDVAPLTSVLETLDEVSFVDNTGDLLLPGQSVEVEVPYTGRRQVLSLASMLLPTNDGMMALNGVRLPVFKYNQQTFFGPGYDAGSEANDELCASIPGPQCGGEGYNPEGGEGLVHIHSGIHGVGDLEPANYDWRNPVVKVDVRLVRR